MGACQECCHNRCGYTSVECVCCGEDVYICSEEEKTYEDCGDDFTCCDCAKDFIYCEGCREKLKKNKENSTLKNSTICEECCQYKIHNGNCMCTVVKIKSCKHINMVSGCIHFDGERCKMKRHDDLYVCNLHMNKKT